MNFGEFFRLNEIADFAVRDTSGVDLKGSHSSSQLSQARAACRRERDGLSWDELAACAQDKLRSMVPSTFERNFDIDGNSFRVHLKNYGSSLVRSSSDFIQALLDAGASQDDLGDLFKNVYYLSFRGPRGYSSTGANRGAAEVYTQVLMTVKKFSEEHQLDGLAFTPYEPGMGLVYNRFIKNFTDFSLVDKGNGVYLSKKLLDSVVQKWPMMGKVIQKQGEDHARDLENVRWWKAQKRNEAIFARGLVGKALVYKSHYGSKHAGIVYGFGDGWLQMYVLSGISVYQETSPLNDVYRISDHPELVPQLEKLKEYLSQSGTHIAGDLKPYTGALPSDNPSPAPASSGTPHGWGSI
jgi:hypothetical protein